MVGMLSNIGSVLLSLPQYAYVNQTVEGSIHVELTDYPTIDEINDCSINMNIYINNQLTTSALLLSNLKSGVKTYDGKIYLKFNQPGKYGVKVYVYYGYKDDPETECHFGGGGGGGNVLPT